MSTPNRPGNTPNPPNGSRPTEQRPTPAQQGPPWQNAPRQQPPGQQGPPAQRGPDTQRGSNTQRGPSTQQGPPTQQRPGPPPGQQRPNPPQQRPNPQNQPQTNITQRVPGKNMYVPAAPADEQTRAAGREEAKTKAAVIDGPTRNIARNDLPTDMPDLSSVRHPTTEQPQARPAPGAVPTAYPAAESAPLRAMVQIRRIDPWSMLKLSLVISVSLFFVWMVAVGVLYAVLDGMGVWDRLNSAFTDIVANSGDSGLVSAGQIFGYAAVIGLINVVLFTALTTIGSFIYNLCSDLVGGLEVTLADRD